METSSSSGIEESLVHSDIAANLRSGLDSNLPELFQDATQFMETVQVQAPEELEFILPVENCDGEEDSDDDSSSVRSFREPEDDKSVIQSSISRPRRSTVQPQEYSNQDLAPPVTRKRKRKTKNYQKSWEQEPELKDWITTAPGDPTLAYCNYCCCSIRANYRNVMDHGRAEKHRFNTISENPELHRTMLLTPGLLQLSSAPYSNPKCTFIKRKWKEIIYKRYQSNVRILGGKKRVTAETLLTIQAPRFQKMTQDECNQQRSALEKLLESKNYFNDPLNWWLKLGTSEGETKCRLCGDNMVLVINQFLKDGYSSHCSSGSSCGFTTPIPRIKFFTQLKIPLSHQHTILYHWAVQSKSLKTSNFSRVRDSIFPNVMVWNVWKSIQMVCDQALELKVKRLGGKNKILELATCKIGHHYIICVMDRETKVYRIEAVREPMSLDMPSIVLQTVEPWIEPESIVMTNDMKLCELNQGKFSCKVVDRKGGADSDKSIRQATNFLSKDIGALFGDLLVEKIEFEDIQRFLNEIQWRARFGQTPKAAFWTIIRDIARYSGRKIRSPYDVLGESNETGSFTSEIISSKMLQKLINLSMSSSLPSNTLMLSYVEALKEDTYYCMECQTHITGCHYEQALHCAKCRYFTNCLKAFVKHTLYTHFNKTRKRKRMPDVLITEQDLFCQCGFSSSSGNILASHLIKCQRQTGAASVTPVKKSHIEIDHFELSRFNLVGRGSVLPSTELLACASGTLRSGRLNQKEANSALQEPRKGVSQQSQSRTEVQRPVPNISGIKDKLCFKLKIREKFAYLASSLK